MKVKYLVFGLICSLLLNAAGIVFFILFLGAQGRYEHANKARHRLEHNLDMIALGAISHQSPIEEQVQKRSFVSHLDGQADTFGFIPPSAPSKGHTLVVYLHGMCSSYLEPFLAPRGDPVAGGIMHHDPSAAFLSCSYRDRASWGNDAALSDITQNIREVCQQYPIKKIVLMGTSMGGCTALTYAELAPSDIKDLLTGIVSVEAAGDFTQLYHEAKHTGIPNAMLYAFGGTPEQVPERYNRRSFIKNLDLLPKNVRVVEISAKDDTIVPPHFQRDIVEALKSRNYAVQLTEFDGAHGAPPSEFYVRGFDYVTAGG